MMKHSVGLPKSVFSFLRKLEKNNDRTWFNANKDLYQTEYEKALGFAELILDEMNKHDELVPMSPKQSLFRIYRDVRFSKDKRPYKNHFSGRMRRASAARRGGYYYHLEPGNTIIAGGFWNPDSKDLLHIRKQISADSGPLRKIIGSTSFKKLFGGLQGDQVKTAPKGFTRDDPDIDLIRHKQFLVYRSFSNRDVHEKTFLKEVIHTFRGMRPFFDYMSDILTTDLNGESLLEP
ncbi:MAG: DUF2461 domain-containing protein [Saprospiraceae bacterium]|nr:DUF2461 domain-containing protein [Saprospiraceae bacterium]